VAVETDPAGEEALQGQYFDLARNVAISSRATVPPPEFAAASARRDAVARNLRR